MSLCMIAKSKAIRTLMTKMRPIMTKKTWKVNPFIFREMQKTEGKKNQACYRKGS